MREEYEVESLRQQLAEQAEAIDLQLHTNRRIAELEEKVAKWVEKAKNWTASPEAGKMLDGYRAMGDRCAELEAERDQLRQRLTKINDTIYAVGAPLGSEAYFTIREICCYNTEKKEQLG